jgi:dihydroflavonol-4-reductase
MGGKRGILMKRGGLEREETVRRLLAVDNQKVKVFAAELMSDSGWAEAMAGCSHVAHVASPFPTHLPKDENEVIVAARDGVLRVLRFAKAAGVKRFVMTSAEAAISHGRPRGEYTFTEKDWTNPESLELSAYIKSKTIAERAARDWVTAEGGGLDARTVLGWSPRPVEETIVETARSLIEIGVVKV